MMSLVHEHNRGGQSNVVKRARMHAQPPGTSIQPVFTGGTPLKTIQAYWGILNIWLRLHTSSAVQGHLSQPVFTGCGPLKTIQAIRDWLSLHA